MRVKHLPVFLFITFVCASCANVFEYKENKWKYISKTESGNPKTVYIDENRIKHKGDIVEAWTKMVFLEEEAIPFESKEGTAVLMTKRMDSSMVYDCARKTSKLVSYQLYDKKDKFIYNQWLNQPRINYIEPGSIDEEMYLYLCVAKRKEADGV